MDHLEELTKEIGSIVAAPYPVSLKSLDDILAKADDVTVRYWADGHPCQIAKLALAVRDALQEWPYALHVLQRLARAHRFRDAILHQDRTLLDALLTKATRSTQDFELCAGACITLLSAALPETTPLPASAQSFFLQVFDRASESPCRKNIENVHDMLNGACQNLSDILPRATLDRLQKQLVTILKTPAGKDDQYLITLCLWTMHALARPSISPVQSSRSVDSFSSSQSTKPQIWKSEAAREFFVDSKAATTIMFLAFQVVLACKDSDDLSHSQILRSIKIANETIVIIDIDVRQDWCKRNAQWIHKLFEKATRKGINPEVQFQALTFIGLLVDIDRYVTQIMPSYERVLLQDSEGHFDDLVLSSTLDISICMFAPHLDEAFLHKLLLEAMNTVANPSPSAYRRLKVLLVIIAKLADVVQHSSHVRKNILLALSANDLQQSLHDFLKITFHGLSQIASCSHICTTALTGDTKDLGLATCCLLLKAALSAQDEAGIAVPLAIGLVDKQQFFAIQPPPCSHSVNQGPHWSRFAFIQETCTPDDSVVFQDWRTRVAQELQVDTKHRQESMIRTVSHICRDLEERCDRVEEPLRVERQKLKELQTQHDELSAHATALEAQVVDQGLFLDALEIEKSQAENCLEHVESENQDLLQRVGDLHRTLQEAKEEAERKLEAVQRNHESKQIHLRAAIGSRDEICEQQQEKLRTLDESMQHIVEHLDSEKHKVQQIQSSYDTLQDEFRILRDDFDAQAASNAHYQTQLATLTATEAALQQQVSSLRNELQDSLAKNQALTVELETLHNESRKQLDSLNTAHDSEIQKAVSRESLIRADFEGKLHQANDDITVLKRESEITCQRLQDREDQLLDLQNKLDELSQICAEKDAELAEAQELKQQLRTIMGGMGLNDVPPGLSTKPSRYRKAHISSRTPGRRRENRSEVHRRTMTPARPQEQDDAEMDVNRSFGSSTSSKGPTPKRMKSRTAFKVPTINQPRFDAEFRADKPTSGDMSATRRAPLTDISIGRGNLSPVRRSRQSTKIVERDDEFRKPQKATQAPVLTEIGDMSFDASGIFTSTPAISSAVPPQKAQNIYDETTADI